MINIKNIFSAYVSKKPEQSFGGISLSNLTKLAKSIDRRNYCTIDSHGLLVLHHQAPRGITIREAQLDLDKNLRLFILNGLPSHHERELTQPGEFVMLANNSLKFTCPLK